MYEDEEFRKQIKEDPTKAIKFAVIYSYGANEEEQDGILDEENPEDAKLPNPHVSVNYGNILHYQKS